MNVYILGLADLFRGDELVTHLKSLGVEPILVDGIDARVAENLLENHLASPSRVNFILRRDLSLAEVAVVLGHRLIYQQFLATEESWALVLEDDSFPIDSWHPELFDFRQTRDPIIVHLKGIDRLLNSTNDFPCLLLDVLNLSDSSNSFLAYRTLGNLFGTYAYLINRPAAEIALSHQEKVDSTADWPYSWRHRVKFYVPEKTYFEVSLEGSLIDETRDRVVESAKTRPSPCWAGKYINVVNTFFGLVGLLSMISFLKGCGFKQHYKENVVLPFLLRRVRSGD